MRWRLSDVPVKDSDKEEWRDPEVRKQKRCFIFLSYTSNMISSGVRETIKYLVKHKMVGI
ncbi:hypothetical protein EON64_04615 [archaeon]|nr:MAG: hypothetical protein EON64_04615 [archaeon]